MPLEYDGSNFSVPGKITAGSPPTAKTNVCRAQDLPKFVYRVTGLDLNTTAPADLTTLAIPASNYRVLSAMLINPTANLSGATLGIYTAAAAGGTAIVAPEALSGLSAASTFHDLTIATGLTTQTASALYPRLTVAAGTAGTADLIIELLNLDLLP